MTRFLSTGAYLLAALRLQYVCSRRQPSDVKRSTSGGCGSSSGAEGIAGEGEATSVEQLDLVHAVLPSDGDERSDGGDTSTSDGWVKVESTQKNVNEYEFT